MEAQVAGAFRLSHLPHNAGGGGGHPPRLASSAASFSRAVFSSSLKKKNGTRNWNVSLSSPFMGARSTGFFKARPSDIAFANGRRAPSPRASLLYDSHYFGDSYGDGEEEFVNWVRESASRSRQEREQEQERRRSEDIDEGSVRQEMNSSFVCLFERIMVSVRLFLADFAVTRNAAANAPSSSAESAAKDVGLKVNLAVFGFTDGGRWEDWRELPSIDISKAPPIDFDEKELEAAERAWEAMVEEAKKMRGEMEESLTDPEILRWLVAPVLMGTESEDAAIYLQEEARYEEAIDADPSNALLLANFAQFIYLFIRDHDRAELYFKKAVAMSKPADPMAVSRYATFLWRVRGDLEGAEEAYQEAIAVSAGDSNYVADYCRFLWGTGAADCCCYPDDHPDLDSNFGLC